MKTTKLEAGNYLCGENHRVRYDPECKNWDIITRGFASRRVATARTLKEGKAWVAKNG